MYTGDQICSIIDFLVDNIIVKFGVVYFVRLLESLWDELCSIAH